jgi:uncharacterized membrane protein YfcA
MTFDARTALLMALGAFTAFHVAVLARVVRARALARHDRRLPAAGLVTGFVTNFFDTLGIGSFATTTAIWRRLALVRDELIPGTLNVGHTLPTIVQAFIFTRLVPVDPATLTMMIAAAVAGAWLGAGMVSRMRRRHVQLGMGLALLVAALLIVLSLAKLLPGGGDALRLDGTALVLGMAGNFILGSLMTIGIGLYAPCMILIYLLGMNPLAAFPIMMGSCAFLMPVASARFVRAERFDLLAALALSVAGLPAVLFAAFVVKSLPLDAVRILVVLVVVYTATGLLRAANAAGRLGVSADGR